LYNGQTDERLVVKAIGPFLLISRYPVAANQEWIEANEQEIVQWDFDEQKNRQICFERSLGQNGGNV
jgi:hypothetical protein